MNQELSANTSLSHYRIVAQLGAGGMGQVYLAEDTRLGRKVAIKLLPAHLTADPQHVRRFEQEARAASALNHPNIVTIYEIGETEAGRYIVMELVAGRTLRAMAKENPAIESILAWGRQVAESLRVAHEAGITHRDIKPENIMVRDDGYVKLLDFGVARLAPETARGEADLLTMTNPGTLLGTVRYMSPEQTRGETATSATDIFALGVVLYELATRRHPFNVSTLLGTMQAINSQEPLPPSRLNPAIPPALDTLILQMLEKDARRRPGAAEVEATLSGLRGSQSGQLTARSPLPTKTPAPKRKVVGRAQERAELQACFAAVNEGRGLLACLAGEPGIGKTALVEDFLAELRESGQGYRIARGRCSERLAGAEAYLPWLEALDSLLRYEGIGSMVQTMQFGTESIAQTMRQTAPTWYAQVAPLSSDNPSTEKLLADLKGASQERMKLELSALLQEISALEPLVLFFDDLHWADVSTIDLLAYIAGKFATMRVLIITTYRTSDLLLTKHPFLQIRPELQSRGVCREIPLEFLSRAEIENYLELEFPGHRFPAELPALIHAKTEGNPLFMADLVRYLRDRGVISRTDFSLLPTQLQHTAIYPTSYWTLAQPLPDIERELPESVRGMIERKIGQLGEEERRLLVAASVQGYEFDSAVLAQALGVDAAETEERLESLERVHAFVRMISEGECPAGTPTLRYRFIHVLYQNTLYASLRPTRKAQLSAAVAQAMLTLWGAQSGTVASRLAHLFAAARDFARAAEYYLIATERAANVLANAEATVLARRGLEMLKPLPASPERRQLELKLQLALGFALVFTQGYASPEAGKCIAVAREICEQLGETPQLFPAIWGLWLYYTVCGKHEAARARGEQLLRLAQSVNDPLSLVGAHFACGFNLFWLGEMIEGHQHFEQGRALYNPQQHLAYRLLYRTEPGMACHSFSMRALCFLGYPDQARRRLDETLALAHQLADPHDLAFTKMFAASFYLFCQEADQALEMIESCLALCNEYGLAQERQWATIWLGRIMAEQNQVAEGLTKIRASIATQSAMRAEVSFPHYLAMLSEVLDKANEVAEALATVAEAFAVMERTGERFYEAELHRIKGELLLKSVTASTESARELQAEAAASFLRAKEVARQQSAKSFELRAAMGLARLWQQQDRRDEARPMLAEVFGWFSEGFDTADLKEARRLLDELA